jgi:hypothetical protein
MAAKFPAAVLSAAVVLAACQEPSTPTAPNHVAATFATEQAPVGLGPAERAALLADRVNARLAAKGVSMRLGGATFFTVGQGVPEFRRLRTGDRWQTRALTYILDDAHYTTDVAPADVDAALVAAQATWGTVPNAGISTTRVPKPAVGNIEFLDQIILDGSGACVDIEDPGFDGPYADIVTYGWIDPAYFSNCLGSDQIIGVTWTFFDPTDANHDNFDDLVYAEQYFNPAFKYTTTDAVYLDFTAPIDIQSVFVHEDGHTLGLDHTGGPNPNQPFKLHPDGRVFDPEAIMNPFYLGGEKRSLFPLDMAALRTLYARPN